MKVRKTWLEYCPSCKKKHRVKLQPCPNCDGKSGEYIPMPVSEKVLDKCCFLGYRCCGCVSYEEHLSY